MRGIDVSYAQGKIDWAAVREGGVDFAMIKATQGRLLKNAGSGAFADPRFRENIEGALRAGVPVGVYHYLTARNLTETLFEADYFLKTIRPYREKIALWAVCDVEESTYLPSAPTTLTDMVHAFMHKVAHAGYKPMLYANPNYLRYRLGDMSRYPLWLAYWGTTEARALGYNPKIWQYGSGYTGGVATRVDLNRGYFAQPI